MKQDDEYMIVIALQIRQEILASMAQNDPQYALNLKRNQEMIEDLEEEGIISSFDDVKVEDRVKKGYYCKIFNDMIEEIIGQEH